MKPGLKKKEKEKEKKTLLFSKKSVDHARDIYLAFAYKIDIERKNQQKHKNEK